MLIVYIYSVFFFVICIYMEFLSVFCNITAFRQLIATNFIVIRIITY